MVFFDRILEKKKILKNFLLLSWILCWGSLSYNPENLILLFNDFFEIDNIIKLINFLFRQRGSVVLIIFPFILILFFLSLIKKKKFLTTDYIYFSLLFFFLFQAIGLMNSDNSKLNFYYLIMSLKILMISYLIKNDSNLIKKNFTIINNLIFFILFLYFTFKYFYAFYIYDFKFYSVWADSMSYENSFVSRPTGFSRFSLIIFIYTSMSFIFKRNISKFFLFIMIVSLTLIILLGSRAIISILFIYIITYYFYFRATVQNLFYFIIKNFLIYPLIFYFIIIFSKNFINYQFHFNFNDKDNSIKKEFSIEELNISRNYPKIDLKKFNVREINKYSSGRINIWNGIINKNKNVFSGYGPMGDRFLISQSASNIVMYSYSASGIIGVIILLLIMIYICINNIKFFFLKRNNIHQSEESLFRIIIIAIFIRSLFETSFAIFGVDLIIISSCLIYINFNKKNL